MRENPTRLRRTSMACRTFRMLLAASLVLALVVPLASRAAQRRLVGARLCLTLRGGARRRKDWQSPRPGDSDEVYAGSQSEDPDWSLDHDGEPRAIVDGDGYSSDISSFERNDGGSRRRNARGRVPRENSARGDTGRRRARSGIRARNRYADESEDGWAGVSEADSSSSDNMPLHRRTPASTTGQRWGMEATDALEAALRGKRPSSSARRPPSRHRHLKRVAPRRARPAAEPVRDDSSDFELQEPTSFTGKIEQTGARCVSMEREQMQNRLMQELECEATEKCVSLPPYVQQSSIILDHAASQKSTDEGGGGRTLQSMSSSQSSHPRSSPRGSPSRSTAAGEQKIQDSAGWNDEYSLHHDGDSLPLDENEGHVADYAGEAKTEEILHEIAGRLECKEAVLFMPHDSARVWRGVSVATQDNTTDGSSYEASGTNAQILHASILGAIQTMKGRHGDTSPDTADEVSTTVAPVSTSCVMQGLGAVMSSAAEAVALVGERKDLDSQELSDDLLSLAERLDAARKQGEVVSHLLQAPERILNRDTQREVHPSAEGLVSQVEENLRCWRRRAIVTGAWHGMRRRAEPMIKSRRREMSDLELHATGVDGASSAATAVYVGGCYGASSEELRRVMSSWGKVVGLHKADAYAFVEVGVPTGECLRVRSQHAWS